MTTYTTTAIATNSVTNTVTVASISNMFSGLPITFSGVTFGGITQGSTYYIGTITYGYPTSQITLTSLPGGAVFQLTTATGTMTAAWSSGGQQIIVTTPPGENLNTAFTKINTNFDQLWAAGPVNSNIKISNNTIYTLDTNGDLILNPNGTGNVVANAHVVPDTTLIRNLGSPTRVWNELYAKYADIGNVAIGQLTIPVGNLHITGGTNGQYLQTDGAGNLDWNTIPLSAGGNNTQIQYNNTGVLDGSNTFTFNNSTNTVTVANIDTTAVANLNNVSNVRIGGGTTGFVLQTDGTGNLSWAAPLGNTQIILDQQLVGDSNTTQFNLITPAFTNSVLVSLNGVQQLPNVAYSISGNVISFTEAPATSDVIDIRFLTGGQGNNTSPGGANGSIQFNSGDGFGGTANLTYNQTTGNLYTANVVVSGNATASYYYGDGSYLTGITATANTGTITFANNIISTSNANAAVNLLAPQQTSVSVATGGNAATAQLLWATNIGALTPDQIYNGVVGGNTWGTQISVGNTGAVIGSNSVAGLTTWTFGTTGTLSGAGGVVAGNISSGSDVTATANISAVGNVIGTYILGNVAFATGVPQSYGNSNVYALLNGSAANIVPLANVGYALGNATNQWLDIWTTDINVTGNIGRANYVTANYFAGDGSQLTNLAVSTNKIFNGASSANIDTADGNLVININGPVWSFNTDGSLTLPAGNLVGLGNVIGPGNISYPFGPGPVLLANTAGNNSAYFSLTAVANATGVLGYMGMAQFGANSSTGLVETVDDTGVTHDWYFNSDGTTTFPAYTFPNVDGTDGQVLTSYGNAQLYWANTGTGGGVYANTVGSFGSDMGVGPNYAGNDPAVLFSDDDMVIRTGGTAATGDQNSGQMDIAASEVLNIGLASNLVDAVNINTYSSYINFPYGGNTVNVIAGTNYLTVDAVTGLTYNGAPISATANTGNITFNNSTIVGPSFGVVPSANSSVYIQPTVDSANVFRFGADGNITASGNLGVVVNSNLWSFDTNGTLTLPGNTLQLGLIAGNTGLVSQNAANITVNANGNTWTFDTTGNLSIPGALNHYVVDNLANLAINSWTPIQLTTGDGVNTGYQNWTFDNAGELTLPSGGRLGFAGKGWTGLDGGNGNAVSVTSFYANGFYAGCVTNNPDGNVIINTYTGNGLQGNWTFDNGANLVLAPTNYDGGSTGESAKFRGTRKIVNGATNSYAYSTVLAAGGTPTVAYTATDSTVQSVRVTFAVQGSSSVWEQFDVVVVQTLPQGNVNFTVTNRVKANDTPDTVVTATWNGTAIEIALTLDASQTGGGWASFDAVEFGLMAG